MKKVTGRGWALDTFWLASICYADDVLLVGRSLKDVELMTKEVSLAFQEVGLDVSSCWETNHGSSIIHYLALVGTQTEPVSKVILSYWYCGPGVGISDCFYPYEQIILSSSLDNLDGVQ